MSSRSTSTEPGVVSENAPKRLTPRMLGASKGVVFVHAAVGRSHTLLVGSNGDVWTAGANALGQCGHQPCPEVSSFTVMRGPSSGGVKEKIVKVGAGITFSILLAESGKLYAVGSGEHGQLGNGRTGEHIATGNKTMFDVYSDPVLVKGLEGKVITQISCGHQHTIAMDKDGFVYVWGYNGYCRLGLGNQQDVLIPKVVPQVSRGISFRSLPGKTKSLRAIHVSAGPSNSIVLDRQKMYYMAGKWKNSGEGSSGSPFSTFRFIQDIMGCKIYQTCSGGVTHFALAPDESDGSVMTIGFGQNAANGELGFGPSEPKSATKPTRHQPLLGVDVIDIAASQNTTFFLARPNEKLSDLPRHPALVDSPDECVVCGKDKGDADSPLECDKCDFPYHLGCLDPPLAAVPDGEWFCPRCSAKPGRPVGSDVDDTDGFDEESAAPPPAKKRGRPPKNKQMTPEDEDGDTEPKGRGGQKRKAPEPAKAKGE
ncbi:RCC1/BLIP-II [Phellopilus nigrolimitatus]|nr:RCC1/BLIP-II [Phellopilus nigrolimitatus]